MSIQSKKKSRIKSDIFTKSRGGKMSWMWIMAAGPAGVCFAFFLGFLSFLGQIHAASRSVAVQADAIVVFSGEPRRIRVATNLMRKGFGQHLLIVGQDNRDEIDKMRNANRSLFECCVTIDDRSRNTAEDALLARNLIRKIRSQSLTLVTSSFHMPRAKKELIRLLPEVDIKFYGVYDDFYKLEDILFDTKIASAFLTQYILFVASSIPDSRHLLEEKSARKTLQAISSWENLMLVILATAALIVAAFAFSKHRRRHRQSF